MFDSLKCAKVLEGVGVSREQAEAHIQVLTEVMETNLATKLDIRGVEDKILATKLEIKLLEQQIIQSEQRMTIKLGTIVSLAVGVILAFLKSMH